jgi:hypothetical protein
MRNRLRFLCCLMILIGASVVTGASGQAASQSAPPKGLTISPAFGQIIVKPDETEHPLSFTITNNENAPINVDLSSADFNTLNESGGLFFVGTNPTALQQKYGLANWLSLPQKNITLLPKQTRVVSASIINSSTLAPGGHYGALLVSQAAATSNGQPANKVDIHPITSSLMFVTKLGGDTHVLKLLSASYSKSLISLPKNIDLRFSNEGNTHLVPRGFATITNSKGQVLSRGILNENSGIILPQTTRGYQITMNAASNMAPSGKYKLTIGYRFDGISGYRFYAASLLHAGLFIVLLGLAILLAMVAAVYRILRRHSSHK